jgi:biopolymer transport protein ExbD
MADIAFLLLIFFLVTTTFPKDKGLAVVLPDQDVSTPVSPRNVMHLLVLGTGEVEIRRGESQQAQLVAASQVGQIWRADVAENPLLIAAVKTGPDAAYRHMVDVLDQLQAAGARRVSLQMLER